MNTYFKIRRTILMKIMRLTGLFGVGIITSCVAKYGVPEEESFIMNLNGVVKSNNTEIEIQGIEVQTTNSYLN